MSTNEKPLDGYEVLLCVTGGIACYKSADLASKLVQAGCGVTVAMTDGATKFIAPLTFGALTRRQVFTSIWQSSEGWDSQHISLTEKADLMLIAPATANILAKMACGISDDLVSCMALSSTGQCPILAAPAMNSRMWCAPATQENVGRLKSWGVQIVGPGDGYLACGTIGAGRLADVPDILAAARQILLRQPPKRKKSGPVG